MKRNIFNATVLFGSVLTTGGCAHYQWVNRNDSGANFQEDAAYCQNEATKHVSLVQEPLPPASYTIPCSGGDNAVDCNTKGGNPNEQTANLIKTHQAGAYQSNLNSYYQNCLVGKDWYQVDANNKN